jgi:hypothetical protein
MAPVRVVRLLAAGALLAATAVVVTSLPSSAVDVGSEAELRAAFADVSETSVVLTADISLTDCAAGDVGRPGGAAALTLSGAFTITQTCANERVIGSEAATGALTIQNAGITGGALVGGSGVGGGIFWQGDLTLLDAALFDNSVTSATGGLGGGFFATGTATVTRSVISGNTAGTSGTFGALAGALSASGGATITDSLVDGNTAEGGSTFGGSGGAIFGNGDVVVERSTFSDNQATASGDGTSGGNGGAIVINAALTVTNSTITGNVAAGSTSNNGGLASGGDMLVAYSTVVGNSAADDANLQSLSADPEFSEDRVFGTVIAEPLGGGTNCGPGSDAGASQGYNFSDDDSCNLTATGDQQSAGDPELGDLGANGGPTPTMLPADSSPLIDAIPDADCQTGIASGISDDQRGVTRPQQTGCDIGAVEVEATPPTPTSTPGGSMTPGQAPGTATSPRFTG